MFGSRRVALAREALTSVTAWAELVVGPDRAQQLASDAVVSAASARGATTLSELTRAAHQREREQNRELASLRTATSSRAASCRYAAHSSTTCSRSSRATTR